MENHTPPAITVSTTVNQSIDKVWILWTSPEHITQWNSASPDWHSPHAANDLRAGGSFLYRMEAKDGSFGFDFGGVYDLVKPGECIEYTLGDGRKVSILFSTTGNETRIEQTFAAEHVHSFEQQQSGWQAIMDNFKHYAETH